MERAYAGDQEEEVHEPIVHEDGVVSEPGEAERVIETDAGEDIVPDRVVVDVDAPPARVGKGRVEGGEGEHHEESEPIQVGEH